MIYPGLKIRLKNAIRGKNRKPVAHNTPIPPRLHPLKTTNNTTQNPKTTNHTKKRNPNTNTTYPQTQQRQLQELLCQQPLGSISYRFFSASTLGEPFFMLILSKDFVPIHSTRG